MKYELLAELYWLEYMDAVADAQAAYLRGEKLQALSLAIITGWRSALLWCGNSLTPVFCMDLPLLES